MSKLRTIRPKIEEFLVIREGGPFEDKEIISSKNFDWPLPDEIPAIGHAKGVYKKVFESKGAPKSEEERRGAKYVWDADAEPYGLSE